MDTLFGDPDREKDGRFKPGNKFWRIASQSAGAPPKFETPQEFYNAALVYFDWVDDNPLKESKVFGTGFKTEVNKVRPMSLRALCIHLGISTSTFYSYRDNREGFEEVIQNIQDIMAAYNYEAAVAGLANANIIARELGLYNRILHGNDPDNPLPEGGETVIFELPDNGRD